MKHERQLPFLLQQFGGICAFFLILMFPSLSGAQDGPDSLTIAISGWEPYNPEDPTIQTLSLEFSSWLIVKAQGQER